MSAPTLEQKKYNGCKTRLTTETGPSAHPKSDPRSNIENLEESIGRYYEDFFNCPDVRGSLAGIRDALDMHGSLRFSDRYSGSIIPLIQETVAWEMYLCGYSPGERDRIEFDVIETLPVGQLSLMFATGLTDTSRISNPRIFVREDLLKTPARNTDPLGKAFDTYAEEIRHSVEALWRNRVGYLTSSQQAQLNRGRLTLPMDWPAQGYCDASFVPQILGESGAHLMDYVRYGQDRYGKGNDYTWDYFVDPVVCNGSVTLCQTDAHRPAQAVDRVILQKLNLWNTTGQLLPTLARRFNQFFILSTPERRKPVSESTLRSWQELHDLPYVVGGLFHRGLEPSPLRAEVLRARLLTRKLHDDLLADGLRIENERVYQDTLEMLEQVSEELGSMERGLGPDYLLRVKQSMWRFVRHIGKALNRDSALKAGVEEIDAFKELPSFYGALMLKTRDAARNVLRIKPTDRETRMLLHALAQEVTAEAKALGLPIHFHGRLFGTDALGEPPDKDAPGHLAA